MRGYKVSKKRQNRARFFASKHKKLSRGEAEKFSDDAMRWRPAEKK